MIEERQDTDGWEFLFLAAGQDAIATAAQMRIRRHNAASAMPGARGVTSSSKAFARKMKAMREMKENERDLYASMEDIFRDEEDKM